MTGDLAGPMFYVKNNHRQTAGESRKAKEARCPLSNRCNSTHDLCQAFVYPQASTCLMCYKFEVFILNREAHAGSNERKRIRLLLASLPRQLLEHLEGKGGKKAGEGHGKRLISYHGGVECGE